MKKFNYIYKITNKINGKIYIGKHSTNDICDNYMGSGKILKNAKIKYGIKNFSKQFIDFCDDEERLNYLEKFYIKLFDSKNNEIGYNITDGGDGVLGCVSYWKGKNIPIKAKEKISKKIKKMHEDGILDSRGEKNGMYGKGYLISGEKHGMYGKHWKDFVSDETYQKQIERSSGSNNPMFGKNVKDYMDEESYKLMLKHRSESLKGKSHKKPIRKKYINEKGEIVEMSEYMKKRFHNNWEESI